MLQLVRAGARGWLRPPGCRVRPGFGAGSEDKGRRDRGLSLTPAHRLQSLNALAEEAMQPAEKPEPVASAGEVARVAQEGQRQGILTLGPAP